MSPDALSVLQTSDGVEGKTGLWELPNGWAWAAASSFATVVGGGTPREAADPTNYDDQGTPWITPADLSGYSGTHIRRGARSLSERGFANSSARLLPASTVLFSSRAPVGYCVVASNPVCTNQGFKSLILRGHIIPEYIRYYMVYNRKYFVDNASGTTFKELSGSTLGELLFPIAPVTLQRRIVSRIDELFAEIAEGEAALERARKGLDTWRRALLKAAVTGELTRDWREANRPTETGADLLARIGAERGAPTHGSGRRRRSAAPGPIDTAALAELPAGWVWGRMADITVSDVRNGISVKGSDNPPGTPALRLDALGEGGIDYTRIRYIDISQQKAQALALCERDFLISRANGSEHLVGRARLVRAVPIRCVYPDTIIRYRIGEPSALGEWLELIWESEFVRRQIRTIAKTTAGILKISQEDIGQIVFPIPPETEMAAAISSFSTQVQSASDASATVEKTQLDRASLRQSILKSAFEGRLVPQDSADEPASALLARLRNSHPGNGARRRRAQSSAGFSHPSLPCLSRQSVDPRVESAGDE
jgi:type I restriction enzyme, S subunit